MTESKKHINIPISDEQRYELRKIAFDRDVSISSLVRQAIDNFIETDRAKLNKNNIDTRENNNIIKNNHITKE